MLSENEPSLTPVTLQLRLPQKVEVVHILPSGLNLAKKEGGGEGRGGGEEGKKREERGRGEGGKEREGVHEKNERRERWGQLGKEATTPCMQGLCTCVTAYFRLSDHESFGLQNSLNRHYLVHEQFTGVGLCVWEGGLSVCIY